MTLGNTFALAVIAMVCTTLAMLKFFGKRPSYQAILAGFLLMMVTFLVLALVAFGHACSRGGPLGVVALGSVFAGTLRATVEKRAVRRWVWIGWFLLTFWGVDLCHRDGYVGNPTYGKTLARRPPVELAFAQAVLRKASEGQKSLQLPAGWIEESWLAGTKSDFPAPAICQSAVVADYWHTWFTGVFSLEKRQYGIWCRGGPVKSCSESLDVRPR